MFPILYLPTRLYLNNFEPFISVRLCIHFSHFASIKIYSCDVPGIVKFEIDVIDYDLQYKYFGFVLYKLHSSIKSF